MKKKSEKKVSDVKQHVSQEEVKDEEQPQRKVTPLAAWDDLMFMGRRPQAPQEATTEDTTEEK